MILSEDMCKAGREGGGGERRGEEGRKSGGGGGERSEAECYAEALNGTCISQRVPHGASGIVLFFG